ncbi:Lipopolysaccharide biosynthesis protein RfbH (fragment) [Frankia canadensis]|uniref:Lipopolysaccharide biosynthesis protein RfbH n=1 Tax=Frankia canadensis TaxID=1836972 RepID=A0A2I2KUA8_9ACTN
MPGLLLPESTPGSDPSWFGFVLTVTEAADYDRAGLIAFLESRRIGTRMLFSGNLVRLHVFADAAVGYRVVGDLTNSDVVTERTFWVGVYPGISSEMID